MTPVLQAASAQSALPPVLLLHGWGGSFDAIWRRAGWCEALAAAGREVLALDLPGHGMAAQSHDPQAYADLASLLSERLPAVHGPLDIVGYSLGGKLALELALREPARVRRLVIAGLGGNVFAPESLGPALSQALVEGVTEHTPPALAALVRYGLAAGNDPLALAAVLRRPANPVITPQRLALLQPPVRLVVGDRDAVAMPIEPLVQALPAGAQVTVLPGVDHLGLTAQTALIDAALSFFL